MNDKTPAPTRQVKAWFVGQRFTKSGKKLAYYWQYENDPGAMRGFAKSIAPALIGEPWLLTIVGDSVSLAPEHKPKKLPELLHNDATKWEAEHVAHTEMFSEYQADERLKKRKDQFERAIEPLRLMALSLKRNDDISAFIRRVNRELWRR